MPLLYFRGVYFTEARVYFTVFLKRVRGFDLKGGILILVTVCNNIEQALWRGKNILTYKYLDGWEKRESSRTTGKDQKAGVCSY